MIKYWIVGILEDGENYCNVAWSGTNTGHMVVWTLNKAEASLGKLRYDLVDTSKYKPFGYSSERHAKVALQRLKRREGVIALLHVHTLQTVAIEYDVDGSWYQTGTGS
jgi:hypothetical protein